MTQNKGKNVVTQVGINWNQLIIELNTWYLFGRDLDKVYVAEEMFG